MSGVRGIGRVFAGTAVRFVGQLGANLAKPLATQAWSTKDSAVEATTIAGLPDRSVLHPSRSLFVLVVDGTCTARQFVCPNSGDTPDDLRSGSGTAEVANQPGVTHFDFKSYACMSYGYQLPYGRLGRPSADLNPRMPIVADKGPLYRAGKPREDGTVPDEPTLTPGSPLTIAGVTTAEQVTQLTSKQWRPYNSRNHDGEGQNVLRVDGSVVFEGKPIVGIGGDNIYTMQGAGGGMMSVLLGLVPADQRGPRTNADSVIVP